ncbi:ADP-ribose pyrophosphatase YjhB (NUDIX family) [Thermosporothrix hazakensis]|jgi:8-oxo-dGTP pyrophosphatase MutT (NUDIX family)|uniref:ADP-ribose pyrophosphatase YjhB (NUDIX family) n=2 Tax=Thermosporothrix TaxID=768650 RepID=A0A326UQL4_THEHA|nr:NUDIX hydrolase [Thermosporothrix hazakensis]PZW36339.1 ADP-ribose pyrophosphatase YjhB (NUDIX family) [Thermosporothrix hazakensis]BBH88804.1 NUDIX hydrolase [Thermosporothrix sp. COM3]GCE46988.1 NUDIX hydrolase [Thermosporothrix hazakensis]
MIASLPAEIQAELIRLADHYGKPLIHTAYLESGSNFEPLNKADRYGEVCMVIRRPNGRLLTMKKDIYPPEAYRLLTGGIHHGEAIFDALLRETQEETGLQVEVRRFLAVVIYHTSDSGEKPAFFTFAFLLDETGGVLGALDEDERIENYREVKPEELPAMARYLHNIHYPDGQGSDWHDWGQMRAVIHEVVWQAIQKA